MGSKGSGINPGVEKNMSKKVLLIAGVLLAAGSIAAISAPHFRGGQLRLGQLLADLRDDDSGSRPARSGKRHREMDAEDEGQIEREDVSRSPRGRIARRDHTDDAEDMPPRARERMGSRSADRTRDRRADGGESGDDVRKGGTFERLSGRGERQFSRLDRNGDGFIDAKEFEIWAAERAARAVQGFLKRFDADGDGKVSRDEFTQFVKDRLAKRGAGGDDQITEAELEPTRRGRGIVK